MNIENKVKVVICGKEYNLRTDENPEYIKKLAERIDKEIGDMVKEKPNFGIQNAAVFVALTSLDEASKARESIENIRGQIKAYVNEAGKARSANEKLSAKVKDLEQKISALEKENKELKKRPALYDCEQLVLENTVTPAVTVYAQELEKGEGNKDKTEAENHADDASADSSAKADNKPAPAVEEKAENNTSADSGDSASSDNNEKQKEAEPQENGEVTGAGSEGNAEAQSNGNNTRADNVNPPKQNQQSRRGRKKKR